MRRSHSFVFAKRPWLAAIGLSALLAAGAVHAETWVVTDQAHPITGQADRLILLDAPARIEGDDPQRRPTGRARMPGNRARR